MRKVLDGSQGIGEAGINEGGAGATSVTLGGDPRIAW